MEEINFNFKYLSSNCKYLTRMNKLAIGFYLEWLNDYLTVEGIASDYGISKEYALFLIETGKNAHNKLTENK